MSCCLGGVLLPMGGELLPMHMPPYPIAYAGYRYQSVPVYTSYPRVAMHTLPDPQTIYPRKPPRPLDSCCVQWSVKGGFTPCTTMLLKRGADWSITDNEGWAPVHRAARWGSMDCLEQLLQVWTQGCGCVWKTRVCGYVNGKACCKRHVCAWTAAGYPPPSTAGTLSMTCHQCLVNSLPAEAH